MKEKFIYLIDYGLSKNSIFDIGWSLRKNKYVVIPIEAGDLMRLLSSHKTKYPLMSIIQNKQHFVLDISFKRRFLINAIDNLGLKYIEFTSFKNAVNGNNFIKKKNIKQFSLPLEASDISAIIHHEFSSFYEDNLKWPGGVRGTISISEKI